VTGKGEEVNWEFQPLGFGQDVFVRVNYVDGADFFQQPLIQVGGRGVDGGWEGKECASSHLPQA
jgi:hypothetical protein